MNSKEYTKQSARTCAPLDSALSRIDLHITALLHVSAGLTTEAAEFTDGLKKHIFYGKTLDEVNLMEELGDLLWYVSYGCRMLNTTMEEVMERNINKLMIRYPEKFTEDRAENRNLKAERGQLEEAVWIGEL